MNRRSFFRRVVSAVAVAAAAPLVQIAKVLPEPVRKRIPSFIVVRGPQLRKEEWMALDKAVMEASRLQLRKWADLQAGVTQCHSQLPMSNARPTLLIARSSSIGSKLPG